MSVGDPSVTFADVLAAANRLKGCARQTPLLSSPLIDERIGARLLVKAEPLQHTGSFKFRGAMNCIAATNARAVVAYSSGNHAQGVALAARLHGIPATIVMPADAPLIKREHTRRLGALVHAYDRYRQVREVIAMRLAVENDAILVKPYDDAFVIAGQGTVGLEIARQCQEAGIRPDVALVCTGGGGLVAGCGLVLRHYFPEIELYAVEPEGFDDTARSLIAGKRVSNEPGAKSICDALLSHQPGELTFEINRRQLTGGMVVSDDDVRRAIRTAFDVFKLVVEPGGAVALAASFSGKHDFRGKTLVAVASGGNIDASIFAGILQSEVSKVL